VAGAKQPILQPIFDLEAPRLVFGRVVLLGDAAFVARPHVATGVTKAALDAQGLADALAGNANLNAALARYDHERRQFGAWLVARGSHIGAFLTAPQRETPKQRAEVLLREYGAAGLVDNERITARSFG
jgi:2-polyprenyl-6-methoxyphenol hydroxylase-like FAD-dependent oxidoreductase